MVCSADDLLGWKDFPRGLRVLLLDEDTVSAAETKSKLEEMDYVVSLFTNELDALSVISKKAESFHVAMVEVSTGNDNSSFRFLETVKDLPTIMISNTHCISTMMKCIALGAAEILQKPLSEDKLRNIWQHAVHKAFNAGEGVLSKSLKPVKETVASALQLQAQEHENELSLAVDKYPAPSTPQLEGRRLLGDCQDEPGISIKKDSTEQEGDSMEFRKSRCSEVQSVDNTCSHSVGVVNLRADLASNSATGVNEEDVDSADGSKTDQCNATKECMMPSNPQNGENIESSAEVKNQKKAFVPPNSCGTRANKKKIKVDWTPDLHRRFVQAVEQLGIDQAIPSRIVELMKVEGLTRHNVASHLQKYRLHRRHITAKEDERRWKQQRDPMRRGYTHRPVMAFPPFHSNCGLPPGQVQPFWGYPGYHPASIQMWNQAEYPMWQPQENWLMKTYPAMQADAWGCPVVPPQGPPSVLPQNSMGSQGLSIDKQSKNSFDLQPAEEVIDKVVKEVINQPWLPLPLGLKPPSTESVLTELNRRGIGNIHSV